MKGPTSGGAARVLAVLRARLSAGPRGGAPVAAVLAQAVVASFLCALVRDALPPFAYGVFALGLTTSLVAIPLLGELGWLLRRDPAAGWVEALPVGARELSVARTLHLLILLWTLALGSLVPAAVFAPELTPTAARFALPLLGLGLASFVAAVLLLLQSLLGERAESILVGLQTLLVVAVVVGFVAGLRAVPTLARLPTLGDANGPYLWLVPPAWFAAPLATNEGEPARWWLPLLVSGLSLALLLGLPRPAAPRTGGGVRSGWLPVLLWPLRRAATALWVRRDERGMFDLVYDALPLEREVAMRTIPMAGIPLAFLVVSALGGRGDGLAEAAVLSARRVDLLALISFSAGIYLPILLTHVPASATPRAAWLHRTAPVSAGAVTAGAIKALVVRFLVPLYGMLAFVAWMQAGPGVVLRITLPGFLVSVLVLRRLYGVCAAGPPLGTAPEDVRFDLDWMGILGGVALLLPVLALLASRLVTVESAPLVLGALVLADLVADRRQRLRGSRDEPAASG